MDLDVKVNGFGFGHGFKISRGWIWTWIGIHVCRWIQIQVQESGPVQLYCPVGLVDLNWSESWTPLETYSVGLVESN